MSFVLKRVADGALFGPSGRFVDDEGRDEIATRFARWEDAHNIITYRLGNQVSMYAVEPRVDEDSPLHDARVQAAFWRRAAEQAVTGWDALEDKIDSVVQNLTKLRDGLPKRPMYSFIREVLDSALTVLVEVCPLEPDTAVLEHVLRELPEIDLGDGRSLRVVEEETPIKKP